MDSVDQQTRVKDGISCGEKRKRGRPRKYGSPGSVENTPLPIAQSPPPGFFKTYQAGSSRGIVFPVGSHTPPLTNLVSANVSEDRPLNNVGLENLAIGAEHNLMVCPEPEVEYKISMETEENTARKAQRQMRRFNSTITEMCTSFEATEKDNEKLVKKVTELEGQIQKLKDEKSSWDKDKKQLVSELDEARKAAQLTVCVKHEMEEKLYNAAKLVDNTKASAKKAVDHAVGMTIKYKTGLHKFVAYLADNEGKSLEDYVNELVKEKP